MDGPEHWRIAMERSSYLNVCKTECMSQREKHKDNTNHYNLSNVFKSTVCNAAILNCVAHKSEGLSQRAAKHLHLENITQSEVKARCQYGGIPDVKLYSI